MTNKNNHDPVATLEQTTPLDFPDAASARTHIFNTPDLKEELVDVPEWGMQVLVRAMTSGTRLEILQKSRLPDGQQDLKKLYPAMVIATALHPQTKQPIFMPADRDALNGKSSGIMERLATCASRLSGLEQGSQVQIENNFQES